MTFTWNSADIKDQAPTGAEIRITNIQRPIIYPVTRRKVDIPGRDYSWDFGDGDLEDYNIQVDIVITATTAEVAQECVEDVASFLTGKENLKFSDSDIIHHARIYSASMASPEGRGNVIRASFNFECDGNEVAS